MFLLASQSNTELLATELSLLYKSSRRENVLKMSLNLRLVVSFQI